MTQQIDARITISKTRCRVEPITDRAKTWLEEHVFRQESYLFGHYQGGRIHQEMLEAKMTLHVIEVRYH